MRRDLPKAPLVVIVALVVLILGEGFLYREVRSVHAQLVPAARDDACGQRGAHHDPQLPVRKPVLDHRLKHAARARLQREFIHAAKAFQSLLVRMDRAGVDPRAATSA